PALGVSAGAQSGSSSIVAAPLFVRFLKSPGAVLRQSPLVGSGLARRLAATQSSTFRTKMSLSVVAAPGSLSIGRAVPDWEAWNTMDLLSGDQLAEAARVTSADSALPSASITNRSAVNRDSDVAL